MTNQAWQYLTTELADTPGRFDSMIRTLLACVVVTIISMALEVPLLSLSLFVIFMVNQENVVRARTIAIGIVVTATVGAALTILILRYTMDSTMIRMLVCAGTVLACAYLMRVSKLGPLFSLIALVVVIGQAAADEIGRGELIVRACLWAWVAVVYPALIALPINLWVRPAQPDQQFIDEVGRQLRQVQQYLAALSESRPWHPQPVGRTGPQASATLMQLQQACALQDKHSRWAAPAGLMLISAVDQLGTAVLGQDDLPSHPDHPAELSALQRNVVRQCRAALEHIQASLNTGSPLQGLHAWETIPPDQALPEPLKDIVRALQFLFGPPTLHASPVLMKDEPMFCNDAWNNPSYMYFGLKAVLSTYFCYILYNGMNWPGIHTCMLTCIIVAVPGLGASTLKGALRIGGCLLGSLAALLATVFLIPELDSLIGLLLMLVPVIAFSAWLAAGSERISYAGLQVMFAFALAILDHFGPSTNLTEVRDRLVGVLLGVTVSAIVNIYFWPDSNREPLRKQARRLMQAIDQLASEPSPDLSAGDIGARRLQIWLLISQCKHGLSERMLEPGQEIAERPRLTALAQQWIDTAVRCVTLVTNAQWDHRQPSVHAKTLLAELNLQMDQLTNWPQRQQEMK